jgi:hypothetical protein
MKFFGVALCLLVLSLPAFGWNDVGHKISAFVAWQRMSPAARERVAAILAKAPEDSGLAALYPQDSRSAAAKQREFFMNAAYWADIVRDRNFPLRNKYHRGNWHYSDIFWKLENGKVTILPNPNEDGGKAIEQLAESERTLRDANASDAEKAIALAWFLHLAGDIHQPAHTSARVTDLEPKGDQGANLVLLSPNDAPRESQMNLHWYWDSIISRAYERKDDAPDGSYLPPIAERLVKRHPFSRFESRLALSDYRSWQEESFAIAVRDLFPESLQRGRMPAKRYEKSAQRISEEQLVFAGFRMGETLERIFGAAR